jgi:hypothetical protein
MTPRIRIGFLEFSATLALLSNVTSPDQTRPIIPLHTSFLDFLTIENNDVFYVDLADAHHQLVHSCLGVMLDNLKFNICKLDHHISPTATSQTLNLELPNTFRLLCRMPAFTGTTTYITFLSSTKYLGNFDPYSRRSFCFG